MHPNRPARSSCGERSKCGDRYLLDRGHDLQLRPEVNLETDESQRRACPHNDLCHNSRIVRSLPFRGMICAWSMCKKMPRGDPQRNRFEVLLWAQDLLSLYTIMHVAFCTHKMNCVLASSLTTLGRSAMGGICVGWLDRMWAAKADPSCSESRELIRIQL